jgi:hypothetical protein
LTLCSNLRRISVFAAINLGSKTLEHHRIRAYILNQRLVLLNRLLVLLEADRAVRLHETEVDQDAVDELSHGRNPCFVTDCVFVALVGASLAVCHIRAPYRYENGGVPARNSVHKQGFCYMGFCGTLPEGKHQPERKSARFEA